MSEVGSSHLCYRYDGVSTVMVGFGFPDARLKYGIVRKLSGAGPSASSFLRARSVLKTGCNELFL